VRLSALRAGFPLPPGRFLVLISVRVWVDPRAIVWLERIRSTEISNNLIKNQTSKEWRNGIHALWEGSPEMFGWHIGWWIITFVAHLRIKNFHCSEGWLYHFKARKDINMHKALSESATFRTTLLHLPSKFNISWSLYSCTCRHMQQIIGGMW
jgi:hypothetical protein